MVEIARYSVNGISVTILLSYIISQQNKSTIQSKSPTFSSKVQRERFPHNNPLYALLHEAHKGDINCKSPTK